MLPNIHSTPNKKNSNSQIFRQNNKFHIKAGDEEEREESPENKATVQHHHTIQHITTHNTQHRNIKNIKMMLMISKHANNL